MEIAFFVGALVLLAALIYGALNYYRNPNAERRSERVVRARYQEGNEDAMLPAVDAAARPGEPNGVEPTFSEEDIQREMFGARGLKGAPDPVRMTPQRAKKTPTNIDQGHTS